MFNNMLSSIGSSVLRVKGGSYLQKEAEKAKSQAQESEAARAAAEAASAASQKELQAANEQMVASRSSVRQSENENLRRDIRNKYMPQDLNPKQASQWRGSLRKLVENYDEKIWDSYINEYLRASSKNSVVDRIALLEKVRGQKFDPSEIKIGGKK